MSALGDLCERILADVQACLAEAGRPVARGAVTIGTATWDECCAGFAYVNVVRTFRSEAFPAEDANWRPCVTNPTAAELTVGVLRCSPTIDDRGNLPSGEAITDASLTVLEDRDVVTSCLLRTACSGDVMDEPFLITGATMLADAGGCIGHETTILVDLS